MGGEGGLEGLSRDRAFQLRPLQPHPLGKGSGMREDGNIPGKCLSPEQGLPPPACSLAKVKLFPTVHFIPSFQPFLQRQHKFSFVSFLSTCGSVAVFHLAAVADPR